VAADDHVASRLLIAHMAAVPPSPKRKVRIRLLPVIGYIFVAFALAWFFAQQSTTTLILVRHADTEPGVALDADPALSERGRRRAELLADFLANVDVVASVDAIYATTARRTQETAEPLRQRLGQTLNIDDPYRVERMARRLLRDRRGKITLFVLDADAIAPLIDELHGSKKIKPLADDDYDELFIVTIPYYEKVKTLQFRYGDPPEPRAMISVPAETFSTVPP
jgi:histidine phosphatase superfamily protein (branch 1)